MFIDNKYTAWYYAIVHRAKARTLFTYTERHHIIPKSLGGTNDNQNLVRLTAREHFICHWLLTKMVVGKKQQQMLHALGMFVQSSPLQERNITAKQYERARLAISSARTGIKRPGIGGVKPGNIPWNKGITVGSPSAESNRSRSITVKSKPALQCPHCGKVGKGSVMYRYHFAKCKLKTN